jgi:predicted nucleic acid-binding Zn ribbon protein
MRDMKSLATILPALFKQLGLEEDAKGWQAVTEWPVVAGERIAKHARAVSFHDGSLTVEVEGSAWLHELGFLERDLVHKMNRHLGNNIVRDVRWVAARGRSLR